jgi:hypothetical protein
MQKKNFAMAQKFSTTEENDLFWRKSKELNVPIPCTNNNFLALKQG